MLYFGRQIFIPLALAIVLGFLLAPFAGMLEKAKLGRVPSVLIVLILCGALASAIGWGVTSQLVEIMSHVGDYKANLQQKVRSIRAPKNGTFSQATATVRELNKELAITEEPASGRSEDGSRAARVAHPIPVQVTAPPSNFVQEITSLLGPLSGPIETTGIVIIFTAFTLIKREDLRNRLIRLGGLGRLHVMTQALDEASRRLSRYLWMQFVVNACYGGLFGLGLYLIGIPHAFLWGALSTLLRFVPYIGVWIAAAFPITLALAVFPGWKTALFAFVLFGALELVTGNALEPWLYGAHTGISSLAILVAAVFWTTLWGPAGLILSTPLTLCLMLAGRYVPRLSFLEVVLGDEPVLKPEEHLYQRLLAMDADDARTISEAYLRDQPLESLYESVFVPALALAEQDRHVEGIDDQLFENLSQNMTELIEDLGDRYEKKAAEAVAAEGGAHRQIAPQFAMPGIVCVPARDHADELVAMMLAQLLRLGGTQATHVSIGPLSEMLQPIQQGNFGIACVSATPPFAVARARAMCKRINSAFPGMKVVIGLWTFEGGLEKAQERIGSACSDTVATTLTEAIMQIHRLAQSTVVDRMLPEEHAKFLHRATGD